MNNEEILATLASAYQSMQERQNLLEDNYSNSVIIPASKVNDILVTFVISFIVACITITICFFVGY